MPGQLLKKHKEMWDKYKTSRKAITHGFPPGIDARLAGIPGARM